MFTSYHTLRVLMNEQSNRQVRDYSLGEIDKQFENAKIAYNTWTRIVEKEKE